MDRDGRFHSRLVAWMKIILPVVALGLLSTLFLVSRKVDLTNSLPLTQIDLRQRAQDQGVTNPSFAGVASGGEEVAFSARLVRPVPDAPARLHAEGVSARLQLVGGAVINVASERGETDQDTMTVVLDGDVHVVTTTGYDLRTQTLVTGYETLHAETTGPVTGTGPPGDLEAGRMVLSADKKSGAMHLVFTDGVKLIYRPRENTE